MQLKNLLSSNLWRLRCMKQALASAPHIVTPNSTIPQAEINEEHLECLEHRDWREYFARKLSGSGLEIGPLHRPMTKHEKMQVDYVDRCTVAELREHYPELKDLPLVEPQIISDAETLEAVKDNSYDFLIASHVIEHMKNPILSLQNWLRVIKPGGLIYMLVPDKRVTFDAKRVRTLVSHIILDYYAPSSVRDFEHYVDYAVHVHNQELDKAITEAKRLVDTDYSIHYHVFMPSDVMSLLSWFSEVISPIDILEGPVMSPGSDEFHFLIKKPEAI